MIVEIGEALASHPREGIKRAHRPHQLEEGAFLHRLEHRLPRGVKAAAGGGEGACGIRTAKRGRDRPLRRHVAAQTKRCEQVEGAVVIPRQGLGPAQNEPADAAAAGAVDLGETAEADRDQIGGEGGGGNEARAVEEQAVVDLIAHQHQAVAASDGDERGEQLARIDRSGRIVGLNQHERPGARANEALDFFRVGQEGVFRAAGVMHGAPAIEPHRRRPQRIVGAWDQHLIAEIEQGAQGEVDQFAHPVADEHPLRRDLRDAASARLLGHCLARLHQPLLVAVRLAFAEMALHRFAQMRRRAKAIKPRIADVEADDAASLRFQSPRSVRQFTADLVADAGEAWTRREVHPDVALRKGADANKKVRCRAGRQQTDISALSGATGRRRWLKARARARGGSASPRRARPAAEYPRPRSPPPRSNPARPAEDQSLPRCVRRRSLSQGQR